MTEFRNENWEKRFAQLGDEAESHFEAYADKVLRRSYARYGLSRPNVQLHRVPAKIRYTPDYLMSRYLVEVQGIGREQKLRLKIDKWYALMQWHHDTQNAEFQGVKFYVWDASLEREVMFGLEKFQELLGAGKATIGFFPEGKGYFEFNAGDLFDE